jgi:Cu/Ag efflux protein CusF
MTVPALPSRAFWDHELGPAAVGAILARTVRSIAAALPVAYAQAEAAQGEVKKVDEAAGEITLKHGPIKNLGMNQGITMVFRVNDPAMLKQVNVCLSC